MTTVRQSGVRLHKGLQGLGVFRHTRNAYGPSGGYPVQMQARLLTGEHIYFRARGVSCTMEVRRTIMGKTIVEYSVPVEVVSRRSKKFNAVVGKTPKPGQPYRTKNEFGCSTINRNVAVALITRWVGEYLTAKEERRLRRKSNVNAS